MRVFTGVNTARVFISRREAVLSSSPHRTRRHLPLFTVVPESSILPTLTLAGLLATVSPNLLGCGCIPEGMYVYMIRRNIRGQVPGYTCISYVLVSIYAGRRGRWGRALKHVYLVFSGCIMNLNLPLAVFIVCCAPCEKTAPQDIVETKTATMSACGEKEGCQPRVAVPPRWTRVAPEPTAHASSKICSPYR